MGVPGEHWRERSQRVDLPHRHGVEHHTGSIGIDLVWIEHGSNMPESLVPALSTLAHPQRGRHDANRDVEQIEQIHKVIR